MTQKTHPMRSRQYQEWIDSLERQWLAGLIPNPQGAAVIITNLRGEVLLQLRDDDPSLVFPNMWSLPGGVVEPNESPADAARREVLEELALNLSPVFWKVYVRESSRRSFRVEQHIFTAVTDREVADMILGEGQKLKYFNPAELSSLQFGFEFDEVLNDFFEERANTG